MANYDTFYFYDNLEQNETEGVYILENIENNQGITIAEADSHFSYAGYYIDNWNTARDGSGIKYLPGDLIDNPETNIFYAIWKKPPKYLVTAEQLERVADAIRENCALNDAKLSYPWGFIEKISNINDIFENFLNGTMSNACLKAESLASYIFCWYSNLISINCPSCSIIGNSAFQHCSNLTSISFPVCRIIGDGAFEYCSNLTSISFPACITIGNSAFDGCNKLTSIKFPVCTTISSCAFSECYNLSSISFPSCTTIRSGAFISCFNLTSIEFPACTTVGYAAFEECSNLTSISFPACITIGSWVFYGCNKLTSIEFSVCTTIGGFAFAECLNLTLIKFPVCTSISINAFEHCSNLTSISFPVCTSIGNEAFSACYRLLSAYFLGSSIPSLAYSDAFYSTPIANFTSYTSGEYGSIFVRASMLEEFKSATNWTYFSDRMVGLTDEEIANL